MFKYYIGYPEIITIANLFLSRPVFHINIDFRTTISRAFEFC